MFGVEHFIWLILCALFITVMTYFSVKQKWTLKRAGTVMTVICAFSEISKMTNEMIESKTGGMVLDPKALPLHLCSLMFVWCHLYYIWQRWRSQAIGD